MIGSLPITIIFSNLKMKFRRLLSPLLPQTLLNPRWVLKREELLEPSKMAREKAKCAKLEIIIEARIQMKFIHQTKHTLMQIISLKVPRNIDLNQEGHHLTRTESMLITAQ